MVDKSRGKWNYCRLLFFLFPILLFLPRLVSAKGMVPSPLSSLELLQKLISFNTSNPPGNELEEAKFIQKYLGQFQIDSEIIKSAPGRGNLIARLKGHGQKKPILLLGHLDVVPADAGEWSHPPFAGKIVGDYLYGRGAIDMKSMVALEINTLVKLKLERTPLLGDVVLALTADEEAGGKFGAQFLTEKYWDKIAADLVLTEGSIGLIRGNTHLYAIQVAEKGVAWMKMTAKGTSGHGSMPIRDNAVAKLVEALHQINSKKQPITKTAIVEEFLNRLSSHYPFPTSFFLKNFFSWPVAQGVSFFAESKIESEKIFNAMVRNTVVPTLLTAGNKINVIPAEAVAQLDCRILPGETPEGFLEKLKTQMGNRDIQLELTMRNLPSESDYHTPYFEALETAIRANDPKAIVVPYISPGATDNRFFRAKGVLSYGIIPLLIPMADIAGLHGKDERVPIAELQRGENILLGTVKKIQTALSSTSAISREGTQKH